MNWWYLAAGILVLLLGWQLSQADQITTAIASHGATFLSSSAGEPSRTLAGSIFAINAANISRNLIVSGDIKSKLSVSGSGVFGVDEYASQIRSPGRDGIGCLLGEIQGDFVRDRVRSSGLFLSGEFGSRKELCGTETLSRSLVSGSGQVILAADSSGANRSSGTKTVSSGQMEIIEDILFGGAYA